MSDKNQYDPKKKIVDPEEFSVKTYLYDLGKSAQEIKALLQILVENQVDLADYINDPVVKKEAAIKVIRQS